MNVVNKFVAVLSVLVYWPFDIIKIWLTWYFWKIGIKYAELLRFTSVFNIKKVKIIMAVFSIYQIVQNLMMLVYWTYACILTLVEKPCASWYDNKERGLDFKSVNLFIFDFTACTQGIIMLGFIDFVANNV